VIEFVYLINTSTRTQQGATFTASPNASTNSFYSLTSSPSIPSLPSIQQTYHRKKPFAPHPDATNQEVEFFFKDYFLATDQAITEDDAGIKAKKLRINGYGLYLLPQESFKDAWGPEGRGIWEVLVAGKYSYVS